MCIPDSTYFEIGRVLRTADIWGSSLSISDVVIVRKELSVSEAFELHTLGNNPPSTLSFVGDTALYTRLNGTLLNEIGTLEHNINGTLNYDTRGAY